MKQPVIITLVSVISLLHYSLAEWQDAQWSDFPFMVAVRKSWGSPMCGGSILTLNGHNGKGAILTAAHCMFFGTHTQIKIGCSSTSCPSSESISTYSVESFVIHPDWDNNVVTGDDIAIVYLTSAITHPGAKSVVLESNANLMKDNDEIVLVGYGGENYYGVEVSDTDTLETAVSHIHDQGEDWCQEDNGIFCVEDDGGSDNLKSSLCNGDSGSPMMRNEKQVGIVSFGQRGCAVSHHQAGALVPVYYEWIVQQCGQYCVTGSSAADSIFGIPQMPESNASYIEISKPVFSVILELIAALIATSIIVICCVMLRKNETGYKAIKDDSDSEYDV